VPELRESPAAGTTPRAAARSIRSNAYCPMIGWARAIVACSIAIVLAGPSPGFCGVRPIKHPDLLLKSRQRTVNVLAFSADGEQIALAGDGNEVEVWEVRTARRLRTIKGSTQVFTIAFSPDGRQLATSSADSRIDIWQLGSDEAPLSFEVSGGPVYSLGYTPDGSRIATGCKDGTIRLYSRAGQLLHSFGDIVSGISVVASPSGARIAGLEGQGLQMWDTDTGELVATRKLDMPPWFEFTMQHRGLAKKPEFVISPGAEFVAVGGDPMPGSSPPGAFVLSIWSAETGKKLFELPGFGWPLYSFSARKDRIAESSIVGISVIDVLTGRELRRYDIDRHFVRSLIFSPDGDWIASGYDDGAVRIWKVQ
jgi:WD40 repeat protein